MSRNPNKVHYQVLGCHNEVMRGHTYCRSHRIPQGPQTGQHAHPVECIPSPPFGSHPSRGDLTFTP
jgi:hypothetical protein